MANIPENACVGDRAFGAPAVAPCPQTAPLRGLALALALVGAAVVAGCASTHPAPIVHRSPGRPPVAVVRPAPPPAPASPDDGPVVESVSPGNAEVRPLGSPQAIPLPGAASRSSPVRTEPAGLKQPYSDQALAMAKSSALPLPSGAAAGTAGTVAAAAPATKAVSTTGFVWPAPGPVLHGFSEPRNTGVAIGGKAGDPVVAASDGRVIFSGKGPRGYGNLVIIKHDSDILSVYAHNQALLVKEGASVKRGQRIAELGSSDADRPMLGFEIRKDSKPVDPAQFLPPR